MKKLCAFLPVSLLATTLLPGSLCRGETQGPPATEKHPVTDTYQGISVVDDYRWLENPTDPKVKAWVEAQNGFTRSYLTKIPDLVKTADRLREWFGKVTPSYSDLISRPGSLFALKFQPPHQQMILVTMATPEDPRSEKIILDPNNLEPKGQVAIDWYVPNPDGSLVAVCLSQGGSEEGTLHFHHTDTGEPLPDTIPRVQFPTGGGSAAWSQDSLAIFYTRYPHPGERPDADLNFYQQIYEHRLGATSDSYSLGKDFPKIAEIELGTSRDGHVLLASVANGDGGEFAHYVADVTRGEGVVWHQVTHFADGIKEARLSVDGTQLYLRSVKHAPRGQILRMPLDCKSLGDARIIVPQSDVVIERMALTPTSLFLSDLNGGPSQLRRFSLSGESEVKIETPPVSGIGGLVPLRESAADDRLLFGETSFTEPGGWYLYEPSAANGGAKLKRTPLSGKPPVDFSDIDVTREFATSKDGTRVPVSILHKKGLVLDGSHPALLTGYGGYGISLRPHFDFTRRLWFDKGGVMAVANLRGGGEYGEEWHLQGNLTKKQNVFDDFAACAQLLITRGYSSSARLAVEGGSNGGLLMGAFLTQHPGMARAVVSHVGIYDMLRVELEPNGAFNVTEFGSVKDPAQFQALHAYSPYHHVIDGAKYPAVFFLAGENDGRVNPANSRKMTARLQAATASGLPILLRQSSGSGHGMGTALSERIAQDADVFAFLFDQLGME